MANGALVTGVAAVGIFGLGALAGSTYVAPKAPSTFEHVLDSDAHQIMQGRRVNLGVFATAHSSFVAVPPFESRPDYSQLAGARAEAYDAAGSEDGLPRSTEDKAAELCVAAFLTDRQLPNTVDVAWLRGNYASAAAQCGSLITQAESRHIVVTVPIGFRAPHQ